jgi:predicted CXXCH cytochrome family protein
LRIVPARLIFLSGILLASLLLVLRPAFPTVSPPVNPHAYFRQPAQCPRCHLSTGSKPDPGWITTSSVEFCLECHLLDRRRTHPLKVHLADRIRETGIPTDYRLGDGERLICLTCHSAHGPFVSDVKAFAGQAPMGVDGDSPYYKTFFLRRSNPADEGFEAVCIGCHRVP